jgi:hypothetical protein
MSLLLIFWYITDGFLRKKQSTTPQPKSFLFYPIYDMPHHRCANNNIIAGRGYLDVCRQPWLGKTIARLQIHFF